jgi:NADH-quinone oxidoreductase subunit G
MQEILRRGPARSASLGEVEQCDAVLILGEDVTQTAPRMALGLRQSVRLQPMKLAEKLNIPLFLDQPVRELAQDDKGPLFIASLHATKLDDIAAATYHGSPDEIARLGFAVAHALDSSAPAVAEASDELQALAGRIAAALQSAERPLVIAGPSCQSQTVVEAAANVATSLAKAGRETRISFTVPESNSFGIGLLGGASLDAAFETVEKGEADTVIILENDLYRRAPAAQVDSFFAKLRHAIVLDQLENATTAQAELLLPAATFSESEGTLVNNEGRAQRFFKVFAPPGDEQPSWQWLRDTIDRVGCDYSGAWRQLDDVIAALAGVPGFENVRAAAPLGGFRVEGAKVPRAPHRYSGRTAMLANISVHEPKPPQDSDSPLSFSMEGASTQPPSALIPFLWSPGWNSIQAANKFQTEIAGPLKGGDPGVRLLDPADGTPAPAGGGYFMEVPAAFERRGQEWLFVPHHHIFGSDEMSLSAPAIAQLAAQPYVALAAGEAQRLGIQPGDEVEVRLDGFAGSLPVELLAGLPEGLAALPAGLPPLQGVPLPSWGRITRS